MEIQIRLARKNDMESILEMSKGIYNGHDYFPHVFLRWLEDPNRGIIVAEKDNTVIGLRTFHIVDDGKTVVSQSLRVHPKYRRQGISAALIQAEHQYVRVHFPSVVTERYTTMSSNVQRLAIQRKTSSDSLVLEMGIIAFYVNSTISSDHKPEDLFGAVRFKEKITGASKVKRLTSGEFRDLLEENLDGVTRENTMIIDWEPFKVHPSNTTNGLVKDGDCFFVSVETEKKREVESLSHGRQSPRVKCLHWVATIYTSDAKLLKIHIVNQLESAILQSKNRPFIFSCFLHTSLVSCAKDFLSQEFSLKYVDFFNFNLLLFEKDFVY